ncbi:cellulose binding domain-containing protein [Streptomyces sp. AV19]|uniref:cellulose binding domain-containing protein n=1 Tax=Streptomyces sp. AV19 TaxID=2793068 RepID=UPI0018FEC1DF|nr:cellulose binding domain-containing protein [Streptomyces sp. AV19]MBH1937959.1 cellulose binding domain-containing protein [Streptomyces sp. AV19]MDG4536898.1 cellulose binding domain-containing protein [Streptomyces sp. AV19]
MAVAGPAFAADGHIGKPAAAAGATVNQGGTQIRGSVDAPKINAAKSSDDGKMALVGWTESGKNIDHFKVYQDGRVVDPDVKADVPDHVFKGLKPGVKYTFGVSAVDKGGIESDRSTVDVTTAPEAPKIVGANSSPDGKADVITWRESPVALKGVDHFNVYQDGKKVGQSPANGTSHVFEGLKPGTKYTFGVTAVDKQGTESTRSTTDATTTGGVKVKFEKTGDWGTGYQENVTITNNGDKTIDGWKLAFDMGKGNAVSSLWDGVLVSPKNSNHVVATNPATYDTSIAPGQSCTIGFVASGTSDGMSHVTVNGQDVVVDQ